MSRQRDLLEIVDAAHPRGGRSHLLHRGQDQADQHGDDGNDDQEFDERERPATVKPAEHTKSTDCECRNTRRTAKLLLKNRSRNRPLQITPDDGPLTQACSVKCLTLNSPLESEMRAMLLHQVKTLLEPTDLP